MSAALPSPLALHPRSVLDPVAVALVLFAGAVTTLSVGAGEYGAFATLALAAVAVVLSVGLAAGRMARTGSPVGGAALLLGTGFFLVAFLGTATVCAPQGIHGPALLVDVGRCSAPIPLLPIAFGFAVSLVGATR